MSVKTYLKAVEESYVAGNATKHSYGPAFKRLLEDLMPDVIATNEPKRVQCGASDFIVTWENVPLGYTGERGGDNRKHSKEQAGPLKREELNLELLA